MLSTESDVTILSLSPKEAFLVVCQSEPEVQIYAIDTTRPLPARFKAKTSTPSPCVSVSWMDARTFVVLTDDNKAVEVDVDGHAKDWIVKEPLIALDVYHGDAAWVKASSPSILSIDGMNDVKLDRVQRRIHPLRIAYHLLSLKVSFLARRRRWSSVRSKLLNLECWWWLL